MDGAKYTLNECNSCGLIYQKEIPNDELMYILYEKWVDPKTVFDQHAKTADLSYYSYYAQEVMQLIAFFKKVPSELKFYDFGMGWGNWARMAKAFGCDSYGTELSPSRIEYAKSHGIKIIGSDEVPEHQFDFINTEQVVEHIPQPLETIFHLKKSLKPSGLLKISVPNGDDIKRRLRVMDWTAPKGSKNSLNPVSPLEHINCFNRSAIIRMANLVGLEPVRFPISLQYAHSTNWIRVKPVIKNILRPIYRNILQKGIYMFFRHKK